MTRKKRKLWLPFSLSPKKIKGWKKYQDKIRLRRWGKKWLVVSCLLLVVAFSFFGYKAFRFLTRPLAQEKGSSPSTLHWNGKTQLNLLVFSFDYYSTHTTSYESKTEERNYIENLGVVSLNPAEGTLKILIIPAETLVTTEKGAYPAKKLFALGATLNPPVETDFTVSSIQGFLAMPIDGYVSLCSNSKFKIQNSKLEEEINKLHNDFSSPKFFLQIPQTLQFIRKDLKTNFSAGQLFRLFWQIRKVRFDKLQVLEIPEHILSSEKINTDEDVLVVNEKLLDEIIAELFAEPEIITERLKVSVKNGTKTPGIAAKAARFLENLGVGVIEVGNAETQDYEETQILNYSKVTPSRTLQRIEDIFGVKSERIEIPEARRVDVEVIVGED